MNVILVNPLGAGTYLFRMMMEYLMMDSLLICQIIEVYAEANSGYQFSHWSNNSGKVDSVNPITFTGLNDYSGCPSDITSLYII